MALVCELSGQVPVEPVVTPEGHLFERRLLEEHLAKSATCPVTGNGLSKKDLISVTQTSIKRPSSLILGSVSDLLKAIQDRVDALNVENYRLLKERDEMRQQLTHLLYIRDGSTRAVAQQMEENKLLRQQLEDLRSKQSASDDPPTKKQRLEPNLNAFKDTLKRWEKLSQALLTARKQRKITARDKDEISIYTPSKPSPVQPEGPKATSFTVAISDFHQNIRSPRIIVTGHQNGLLSIYDWHQQKVLSSCGGHEGAIRDVKSLLYPSVNDLAPSVLADLQASSSSSEPFKSALNIITGSEDGTVRLWKDSGHKCIDEMTFLVDVKSDRGLGKYVDRSLDVGSEWNLSCEHIFRLNEGGVRSVILHPSGTHSAALSGASKDWNLLDLVECEIAQKYKGTPTGEKITALAFQPDGMLAVGATSGKTIPVWDLRSDEIKASLTIPVGSGTSMEVEDDRIVTVAFSEIGYIIFTAMKSGKGLLWDLRKSDVFQEINTGAPVTGQCTFDLTGKHLAVPTSQGLAIYHNQDKKIFQPVSKYQDDQQIVATYFDKLSDDYFVTLNDQGLFNAFCPS